MVKRTALALATGLTFTLCVDAHAFDFSDTSIGYWYGWQFKEPGTDGGKDILQHNVYVSHVDGYAYGQNFFNANFTKWGPGNPANNSNTGASEFYGVYRTVVSGGKVTNSTMFDWGPIRDIGLEAGFDLDAENTAFATGKYLIVVGPQFAFKLPKGFWVLSLHYSREWNNNGIAGHSVTFDPAFEMETAWLYPFAIGPVPLAFTGFLNIIGPKGRDGFGNQTRTEILLHPKLLVDVGAIAAHTPNKFYAGVGYEGWRNKFGNPSGEVPGANQDALFLEVAYHF
jgi:nucleoside-specific outer membrane channel protein Tsx